MTIALTKPISGPTEMSMPPRPPRITGVEAMAAPISGAASPISVPQAAGWKRAGLSTRLTASRTTSSTTAKPALAPRGRRCVETPAHAARPNMAAITLSWSVGSPAISAATCVFAEHQHAVAEQQDLLDLARQDDQAPCRRRRDRERRRRAPAASRRRRRASDR